MYIETNLDECKKLMIEVLKYIDNICKKNDIEYWLEFGTLLGAYRHKGFIPWDDDIDIAMTRKNYEKFIECMKKEEDSKFYLLHKDTKEGYPFEFAKVMMRNTVLHLADNGSDMKMDRGIFVDIFAFDFYNSEISRKKRRLIRQFENARKKSIIDKISSRYYKLGLQVFRGISKVLVPVNLIDKAKKKYVSEDGEYVGCALEQTDDILCKKDLYFPLTEIEFEGQKFPCPKKVTDVLELEFGDTYMQLPPEDKRERHFQNGYASLEVAERYGIHTEDKKVYNESEVIVIGG